MDSDNLRLVIRRILVRRLIIARPLILSLISSINCIRKFSRSRQAQVHHLRVHDFVYEAQASVLLWIESENGLVKM